MTLLGSGAVSALSLAALANDRFRVLSAEDSFTFLTFVQWELLGVTAAKLGVDQFVFARTTEDASALVPYARLFVTRALPMIGALALLLVCLFSVPVAACSIPAMAFDTHAAIMASELNARKRYGLTSVANLLSYPLLLLSLLGLARVVGAIHLPHVLALFLVTRLVRWLCLVVALHPRKGMYVDVPPPVGLLTLQQLLNYGLFRSDQLSLPFVFGHFSSEVLRQYAFLAKFPELAASMFVTAGAVLLPRLYAPEAPLTRTIGSFVARHFLGVAALLGSLAAGLATYCATAKTLAAPPLAVPFLVHAAMIFPVNFVTYGLMRRHELRRLVLLLAASQVLGLGVIAVCASVPTPVIVAAWLVPAQLAAFLLAAAVSKA